MLLRAALKLLLFCVLCAILQSDALTGWTMRNWLDNWLDTAVDHQPALWEVEATGEPLPHFP